MMIQFVGYKSVIRIDVAPIVCVLLREMVRILEGIQYGCRQYAF